MRKPPWRYGGFALLVLFLLLRTADPAAAALQLEPGDIKFEVLDSSGEPEARAGAHPDLLVTAFKPPAGASEDLKELQIDFPPGLGGDSLAAQQCPRGQLNTFLAEKSCPPGSQVGQMIIETDTSTNSLPIFNLVPGPREVVAFGGLIKLASVTRLSGRLRPADQGLTLTLNLPNTPLEGEEVLETRFEFWGVPADHQVGTSIPRRAMLTTPTRCGKPIALAIRGRSWQDTAAVSTATVDTGVPLVDCQHLPFEPHIELGLDNPVRDSPTGVELKLSAPSSADADGRIASQIESMSVELPEGMAPSPGGAVGLATCSDEQLGLGSDEDVACPPASRLGFAEIEAPQVGEPLRGGVYLGQALPGERFRLFVAVAGAGSVAKLVGALRPGADGRFVAVLDDLPEISFSSLVLHLDGGPRALLATPLGCGRAGVVARLTPYSGGADVATQDGVEVGSSGGPCPAGPPFDPEFVGGTSPAVAGAPAALAVTLRRRDGEQLPGGLDVALPPGVSAALGSVDVCPGPTAAAGGCLAGSRIGSAVAELGSGPYPAALAGDVYLTGPYRRAPFGFALVFRALLGSFDLGEIVVRAALRVNPFDGTVTVSTDPLPQAIEGVPVRFRTIGLDVDRPGFIRNPTACSPAEITATIPSTSGASVRREADFNVRRCVDLAFRPTVSTAVHSVAGSGKPALRISMRLRRHDANLRSASIVLPSGFAFDGGGLREICARHSALSGHCPAGSRVGTGVARTPLFSTPLRGGVFVAQPAGHGAPALWVDLAGSGVRFALESKVIDHDGQLEAKLEDLPDLSLSSFTLRLRGGSGGVVSVKRDLCSRGVPAAVSAEALLRGQNGARRRVRSPLRGACNG